MSEVHTLVERAYPRHRLAAIAVRPFPYASTQRLDAVDVTFRDGGRRLLVAKHVDAGGLLDPYDPSQRVVRHDGTTERLVYEQFLRGRAGTVALIAASERVLLLERAPGMPLIETGDMRAWCGAAATLANLHGGGLRVVRDRPPWCAPLASTGVSPRHNIDARAVGRVFATTHDLALERIATLPQTLAHGDCYPANVIVDVDVDPPRSVVVDWAAARIAPCLVDLATLTSGGWTRDEWQTIALSYRDTALADGWARVHWHDDATFLRDVAACRLHVALGNLVAGDRTRDWRADAERAAEDVGGVAIAGERSS